MPVAHEWLMPLAPWELCGTASQGPRKPLHQTRPARRLIVSVDGLLSDQLAQVLHHAALPVFVLESPVGKVQALHWLLVFWSVSATGF